MTSVSILPPVDQQAALSLQDDIENLCGQISSHEIRLARSYARLGSKLRQVETTQAWIVYGYQRFSTFLEDIRKKIGRGRSQIYAILQVAETLLPYLTEEQLEAIGITKAHELRRLIAGGIRPETYMSGTDESVRLMDYAAFPEVTAAQLRVEVNKLLHQEETPQGFWCDLGGCYFLPDERKEWERAVELGKRVSEVGGEKSEHEQLKQSLLAMAREVTVGWLAELENEN